MREINYLHHIFDHHRLYCISYQITISHSTPIIIVRQICSTTVICVYLIVLYLFCIKQSFSNLSSIPFQTKDSNTHAHPHSWLPNDGHRNQQNNQLLKPFLFITCFYIESNPIHQYNVFLLVSSIQVG